MVSRTPRCPNKGGLFCRRLSGIPQAMTGRRIRYSNPIDSPSLYLGKGYDSPDERRHFHFRNLRKRLENYISELLARGELVASGYVQPLTPHAERVTISPDTWRLLSVNFENSTAKGYGLSLVDITVAEARSLRGKGRKPEALSKKQEIHSAFEELVSAGKVNFGHGGLAQAVRLLSPRFPQYKLDSIRRILQPTFKSQAKTKKPVRK
jgi:hypothetical protein